MTKIDDLKAILENWLLPTKLHDDIQKHIFELEKHEP